MNTLHTTYSELHALMQSNPDIKYHVKTHHGEFTPINATVCKRSDTYSVEFSNGVVLTAGDKHCFMNETGNPIATEDLKPGDSIQTLYGTVSCIGLSNFKADQEVYDISIDSPHWYANEDIYGIIHHNTSFALLMAGAYLKKHKDACLMFYDSEFGSPQQYFESFGIDTSRVLHIPIKNIEELKFDIVNQLEQMERKDKVIIVIDSVGNLASKKELEDAMNEKSVADMTRAKALKGLFRMVTPYLTMKNICLLAINHTYQCGTKEMTVKTPNGNVSLAEIKIGDTVLTEKGWEQVSFATSHNDSIITEITLEDGEVLSFTEGHRFKVNGEWKYLNELMPGDVLDEIN